MRLSAPNSTMTPYEITADDRLWLLRAVEAEGPVQALVAATLLNGFAYQRSRGSTRTLTEFVRAYAQPVNPRWFPDGDLLGKRVAFLRDEYGPESAEVNAELSRAETRERAHSTRRTFRASTVAAVNAALRGPGTLPSRATDYAAAHVDATGKGYTPLTPPLPGVNRLWSRRGAEHWQGYVIEAGGVFVVLALLGVVAAWKWWGA